ncbi:MAG: hypothetical protein M3Y78_09510 [Pseudomonadota bacterium]|nr:hypothetical protein [Pseudomonadota bacterium]
MSSTALMPGYTFEIPVIFRKGSGIGELCWWVRRMTIRAEQAGWEI